MTKRGHYTQRAQISHTSDYGFKFINRRSRENTRFSPWSSMGISCHSETLSLTEQGLAQCIHFNFCCLKKMRTLLIALAYLITAPAQADLYKCVKNGATSYQEAPCDRASTASRVVRGYSGAGSAWPWSGLKYGASIEEVQRNIPGVKKEQGSHLHDGSKALLRKQDVIVAGINFDASYFFKDGRLTQVHLTDHDMVNNEVTLRNFEKLSSELREKFGPEEKRNVKKERWGISGEASWLIGSDKLWVSISPVTGDTSQLSFGYNPAKWACTEFCVNGLLAGNCRIVWRHNENEEARST